MFTHNQCIIVLGMHRSGTSALTGVLSLLGIQPGNNLLPALEGINSKGFWEHAEIVSIHEQLLAALGSSWYDEDALPDQWWLTSVTTDFRDRIVGVLRRDFSDQPLWLVKDPRICRLLPLWQQVLRELGCQPQYILSVRNPAEVARSLCERDELTEEASCLLWLTHMLEAEYHTREQSRVFVNYENLLSDWKGAMTNIEKTLDITWPVPMTDAAPSIESFLDPTLRHHKDNEPLPDHPACRLAQKAFSLMATAHQDHVKLDRMRAQTAKLIKLVIPSSRRLRHPERHISKLKEQIRNLESQQIQLQSENTLLHGEIQHVKSTYSWKITKPLRFLANLLRLKL